MHQLCPFLLNKLLSCRTLIVMISLLYCILKLSIHNVKNIISWSKVYYIALYVYKGIFNCPICFIKYYEVKQVHQH